MVLINPTIISWQVTCTATLTYVKPDAKSRYDVLVARAGKIEKEITALRTATVESPEYVQWLEQEPGRPAWRETDG